jgi:hypothetical protein
MLNNGIKTINNLIIVLRCLYKIENNPMTDVDTMMIRPYIFIHDKNKKIDYSKFIINFEKYVSLLKIDVKDYNFSNIVINREYLNYSKVSSKLNELVTSLEFCNILDENLLYVKNNVKIDFDKIINRDFYRLEHYYDVLNIDNECNSHNKATTDVNSDIVIHLNELIKECKKLDEFKNLKDEEIVFHGIKDLLDNIEESLNKGLHDIKELCRSRYINNKLNELEYFENKNILKLFN